MRRDRERLASRRRDGVARRRKGQEERRPVAGAPVEPRRDEAVQAARILVHDAREAEVQDEGAPPVAEPRPARPRPFSPGGGPRVEEPRDVAERGGSAGPCARGAPRPRPSSRSIRRGTGRARDESPGADLASGAHDGRGERLGERAHPAAGPRDAPTEEVDAEGAVPPGGGGRGGLDADEEGEVEEGAERRVLRRALPFEDVGDGLAERREERQEARREEAEVADGVARGRSGRTGQLRPAFQRREASRRRRRRKEDAPGKSRSRDSSQASWSRP